MPFSSLFKAVVTYKHEGPFYQAPSFANIVVLSDQLRTKSSELTAATKTGAVVAQGVLNKQRVLADFLLKFEQIAKAFNPEDPQSEIKVTLRLLILIGDSIKEHAETLNYFRSGVKHAVGQMATIGSYIAAYGTAGLLVSSGLGIGALTLLGGTVINSKSKKVVEFKGSRTATFDIMLKLLAAVNQASNLALESYVGFQLTKPERLDLEACELLLTYINMLPEIETHSDKELSRIKVSVEERIGELKTISTEEDEPVASVAMN